MSTMANAQFTSGREEAHLNPSTSRSQNLKGKTMVCQSGAILDKCIGRFPRRFWPKLQIVLLCILLVAGCATSHLDQFQKFVEGSDTYAKAVNTVATQAGETAIEFDSQSLIRRRNKLSSQSLRESILNQQNDDMKNYLSLLKNLQSQTQILQDYFKALNALATTSSTGAGQAAENLVVKLGDLDVRIKNAKVGDMEVSKFTGAVTNIIVANFRNWALQRELRTRAPFIERQLDLQQAAFKAISEAMKTDLQGLLNYKMTDTVIKPFVNVNADLPGGWAEARKNALMEAPAVTVVENASRLAGEMKQSFVALAEGRLNWAEMQAIIKQAQDIITLVQQIHPSKATNKGD